MIPKIFLVLTACSFIFIISCSKEIQSGKVSSAANSNSSEKISDITPGIWYGTFTPYLGDPDGDYPDTVSEQKLINNGKASVPYDSIAYPSDANRISSIAYQIPEDHILNGDDIVFEAAINDDLNVIQMDLVGSKNIASISYNNDGINAGTCRLIVGNTEQSVSVPVIDFQTFKRVAIALKGSHAYFFISHKLILSFEYTGTDKIGIIKMLSIGQNYKQDKLKLPDDRSIDCDYVKLYSSYSKNLLMKEDFNIVGRSNTIFY